MTTLGNKHNIPLSCAVWLANDTYDHSPDPDYFSATELLRPVKQIILGKRAAADPNSIPEDISNIIASRIGTAVHDAIEVSWKTKFAIALKNLGVGQGVIDRVLINPTDFELNQKDNAIPVYLEQRVTKEFRGKKIGGKFDFVAEGELEDFKSTKVFSYKKGSNDLEYVRQMSIYRWLNPDKITKDTFRINYIFTDWLRSMTLQDPAYPKTQILQKKFNLLTVPETEQFMSDKIDLIAKFSEAPESDIPPCSDEELWRSETVWKYYSKAENKKATKNFDNAADANAHCATKGTGVVREVKGEIKRCNYCPGIAVCKQKDGYLADGTLKLLD